MQSEASPSPDRARSAAVHPWVIWWIGELAGARSARLDGEACSELAPAVLRSLQDVEGHLAALAPRVRVRVDDLSTADDLVDATLAFSALGDFEDLALEAAVPAVARCAAKDRRAGGLGAGATEAGGSAAGRTGTASPGGAGGGDLARMIEAALRGEVAGGQSVGGDSGASSPATGAAGKGDAGEGGLRARQLRLLRDDEAVSRLERSWRSLARIAAANRAPEPDGVPGAAVEIHALDVPDASVLRAARELARDEDPPLVERFEELIADATVRPELVVLDLTIEPDAGGFEAMRGLARLAERIASPVVFGLGSSWLADGGGAAQVGRAARDLNLVPFRTLRDDPASVLLAAAMPSVLRSRDHEGTAGVDAWRHGAGAVVAEAIVTALSGPQAGRGAWGALRAGLGSAAIACADDGLLELARQGYLGLRSAADAAGRETASTAPTLPTVRSLHSDADPRSGDLRARMVVARLSKVLALAAARLGAPSNDPESLARFATELLHAVGKVDIAPLGTAPEGVLEPGAPMRLSARYDSHDERSLCVLLEIVCAAASGPRPLCRAAFYPFA